MTINTDGIRQERSNRIHKKRKDSLETRAELARVFFIT